jgi:hypothetical protein
VSVSIYMTDELAHHIHDVGQKVLEGGPEGIEDRLKEHANPSYVLCSLASIADIYMNKGNPLAAILGPRKENGPIATVEFIAAWLHEHPEIMDQIMDDPRWKRAIG